MPLRNEDADTYVQALRSEGRLRAWYATILAGTIAVLYLSTSFPFELDLFPGVKPVSNVLTAAVVFLVCLTFNYGIEHAWMGHRRTSAGLSPLRSPTLRRLLHELNAAFGIKASAVATGSNKAGNLSSLRIGGHFVIAIGRGALPLIVRDHAVFRYRLAHEYAHLAAGDPPRDRRVAVVYMTAFIFLAVSYGSSLYNEAAIFASSWRLSGLSEALGDLTGWMFFGIEANVTLFSSILLMLYLERRSAARLTEFYADAAATHVVGPIVQAFGPRPSSSRSVRDLWALLFGRHPAATVRSMALIDRAKVYQADMLLFTLQGFFSAFIIEIVLQLLFSTASATLANIDDRRASFARFLAISRPVTLEVIGAGAMLAGIAYFLLLKRLATTIHLGLDGRAHRKRFLLLSAPVFSVAGTAFLLATSTGVQWDLEQTRWNLFRYASVAWDRLAIHEVSLLALCSSIAIVLAFKPKTIGTIIALGYAPVGAVLLAGYRLYWP